MQKLFHYCKLYHNKLFRIILILSKLNRLLFDRNRFITPYGTILTTSDFGLPSKVRAEPKNPHCLNVTWKKAIGPVTEYRVYCFPGESEMAEIIKQIPDGNTESAIISGLKPEETYRVAITSVSNETEGKFVFSEDKEQVRMCKCSMRKCSIINLTYFCSLISTEALFLQRALFGATWIDSYTRMARFCLGCS